MLINGAVIKRNKKVLKKPFVLNELLVHFKLPGILTPIFSKSNNRITLKIRTYAFILTLYVFILKLFTKLYIFLLRKYITIYYFIYGLINVTLIVRFFQKLKIQSD